MDWNKIDIKLLEKSPIGIMLLNREGEFKYANKEAENILGIKADLITNRTYNSPEWNLTDFDGNALPDQQLPFSKAINKKKAVYDIELALKWPNGKKVYLSVNATPIKKKEEEIEAVLLTLHNISHRVLSEIELLKSKKRYTDLFNNLIEEVHIWKFITNDKEEVVNWELVDVNPSALNNWGKNLEEVKGKLASEIFGNEALDIFKPMVNKIFKTRQPERWEVLFPPTQQILSMDSIPIDDLFISTGRDVTKKRELEQQLRKLSLVASHTRNGVIITGPEGRIDWVNKAFTKITEYTLEESRGKKPGDFLHGEATDPETVKRISKKLKQKIPFTEEILNYTKSGAYYWIKLDITPILDEQDEVEEFIAIQEEITAKKEAEIALQKRTNQLNNVLNNLNSTTYELVLLPDGSNQLSYISEGAQKLYGFTREQIIDNLGILFDQIHPDDTEALEVAIEKSATSLSFYDHTFRYIMPTSGEVKYIRSRGIPKKVGDKIVWTTSSIDDTDKMRAQNTNKVLVSEVHHRVKNNLAIISGLLQLEMGELKDEMDMLPMQRSINRIQSMANVHELLYQNNSLTNINIKEYIGQLTTHITNTNADSKNISLHLDVENIELNVNEAIPLGMLLNELLTNSYKYAFDDNGGDIRITLKDINDYHQVLYYDNGKGFKENINFEDTNTLGMMIIHTLLEQLEADYEYNTKDQFELKIGFSPSSKGAHSNL